MLIAARLTLTRPALALATLAVVATATLAASQPAHAAKTAQCAKQVIADWYDNGRVDKIYPLHCYREAIRTLPVDVRDYSSAREDILRALAYAEQGKPDPGDGGTNGSNGGAGGSQGGGGSGPTTGGGSGGGGTSDPGNGADPGTTTSSTVDTSGPSAVPIPLIVLAAIAGLLLVLGAAGYVTRRSGRADEGESPPTA